MSYPGQGGSSFEIHEAPPPPQTAHQLVAEQGIEAVREALPAAERQAFDQANPWRTIERAGERIAEREGELNAFDQDLEQHIAAQGYTPEQAQVVYAQTADLRQPLQEAVQRAEQRARDALNTYSANLINFVENRRLTQIVAFQTGQYSMHDPRIASAAALSSSGNSRRDRNDRNDRNGHNGGRPPLRETHGNRRRGRG